MNLSGRKWVFKLTLFSIFLLSIVQVRYRLGLPAILAKKILILEDYGIFSTDFKTLVLLAGLLLLLSVFWNPRKITIKPSGICWILGFTLTLGAVAVTVAFINPTGRFPWNERASYATVSARSIKPNLYAKLKKTPEIIILGSSVSFTTPADYLEKKWGVSAFNMALNGGSPGDFITTMNYIIQEGPDGKVPLTVLVELVSPTLKIDNSNQTPVKMLSYMPLEQRLPAISQTLDYFLKVTPFSDSIFTILFLDTNRWKIWIKFSNDGTGIRMRPQKPRSTYQAAIKSNIKTMKSFLSCKELDLAGKESIEKLIRLSSHYQFSIVFYRTPINNDFYKASKTNPASYEKCKKEFDEYMMAVKKKNQNIFYKDLSQYPEISTQGMSMYIDTHHLKRSGAILLMNALDAEIKTALEWAKQK